MKHSTAGDDPAAHASAAHVELDRRRERYTACHTAPARRRSAYASAVSA
jgi:hypothetical protein